MFTKRVGFEVPEGITLIESRLSGFIPEEKDLRDELIAETKTCDTPFVVFDLPYHEYVKSFGRGFTVMVLETPSMSKKPGFPTAKKEILGFPSTFSAAWAISGMASATTVVAARKSLRKGRRVMGISWM